MARDPNNIHRFSEYGEYVPDVICTPELEVFARPDYDLNDEKEVGKYLFDIEKTVRGSFEYQQMVQYCREYLNMNACSFYQNVSNAATTKIRIEIHHEPLTLYDIVKTVYNKRVHFGESLEVEMVAKEVTYNHYAMHVGLIPLADTVHDLVHNQYLFIPNDRVYGNWRRFEDLYHDFIDPETSKTLDMIEQYTQEYNAEEDDSKHILAKHFIYVDEDGTGYRLPKLEDIRAMLKDRVNELLNVTPGQAVIEVQSPPKKELYEPFIIVTSMPTSA